MTQPSKADLTDQYFKMEGDHSLFDLRSNKDFPIWDIVRNQIWTNLIYSSHSINNKLPLKKRMIDLVKVIILFPRIFITRKKYFFFGASRFLNQRGEYYDPYFEQVKNILGDNVIFYESNLGKERYVQKEHIFSILPNMRRIIQPLLVLSKIYKKNSKTIDKIVHAVNSTFGTSITDYKEIEKIYFDFLVDYYFYKYLFILMPYTRCILMHQNGFQKGLILASQFNNINIIEFQHADIVEANLVWHYGYNKFNSNNDIIFPNIFLTYSDVWSNSYNIPCKSIEIGSNHHNIDPNWIPNSKSIGIISTKEHEDVLNCFVTEAAHFHPDISFLYKLHPGQFHYYDKFVFYFKDMPNVTIIPIDLTMKDFIHYANEYVVIYSSVIFELLQAGKIVYIYKKLNYSFFKKYYTLPNIYLFTDIKDFNLQKISVPISCVPIYPIKFFKPFSESKFRTAIED